MKQKIRKFPTVHGKGGENFEKRFRSNTIAIGQYQHTWLRFSSEFLFEKEDLDLYVPSWMVATPATSDLHAL